jgi:hypothetical protein
VFLTSLVKFLSGFILTVRPDISDHEPRIYLTLGRCPYDIEVFRLVLFVIKVEDVAQMSRLKLRGYVEAHDFPTRINEYFRHASCAFKKFQ